MKLPFGLVRRPVFTTILAIALDDLLARYAIIGSADRSYLSKLGR
jgi:hypothetical protein